MTKENFCMWGIGDCGSTATLTNNIHNNYLDASSLKIFTDNVNQTVSNSLIKSTQQTSSAASSYAEADVGNIVLGGSHNTDNIAVELLQQTNISVKSLQQTVQAADMQSVLANAITANLKSMSSSNDYANLVQQAQNTMKTGALATPQPVTTNANNNIWNNQTTVTDRDFSQRVENYIKTSSQNVSMTTCSSNISQDDLVKIGNIVAEGEYNKENATISLTQLISDKLICKEFTNQSNTIITKVLNQLGIKTDDTTIAGTETKTETKVKNEVVATGPIQDFFNGLTNFFGQYKQIIIAVVIACVVLCCLSSLGSVAMMMMGSKSSSSDDDGTGTGTATSDDGAGDEE
jgi:hypothetical protein